MAKIQPVKGPLVRYLESTPSRRALNTSHLAHQPGILTVYSDITNCSQRNGRKYTVQSWMNHEIPCVRCAIDSGSQIVMKRWSETNTCFHWKPWNKAVGSDLALGMPVGLGATHHRSERRMYPNTHTAQNIEPAPLPGKAWYKPWSFVLRKARYQTPMKLSLAMKKKELLTFPWSCVHQEPQN